MQRKAFITAIKQSIAFHMILPLLSMGFLLFIMTQVPIIDCIFPVAIDSHDNISEIYAKSSYVTCTPGKLYYTGYDYMTGNRIKGHYFYTLVDGRCTFYIISCKYLKSINATTQTLENVSFKARLMTNGSLLNDLTTLMAGDLNWTHNGLSSHTSSVFVSELHDSPVPVIIVSFVILLASMHMLCSLFLLIYYFFNPLKARLFFRHIPGKDITLSTICDELENDSVSVGDGIYVTQNHIVKIMIHSIIILPLKDITSMTYYVSLQGLPMRKHLASNIQFLMDNERVVHLRHIFPDAANKLASLLTEYGIEIINV